MNFLLRSGCVVCHVLIFLLFCVHVSHALSNADYERYKSSSTSFAQADQDLNALWSTLKQNLPQDQYKELLGEQRKWLREVYDAEAKRHMPAVPPAEAYALALNGRVDGLKRRFHAVLQESGGRGVRQDQEADVGLLWQRYSGTTDAAGSGAAAAGSPVPRQDAQQAPAPGTAVAATLPAQQDPSRVQVAAEGLGATKMEALQAAWMEAVRQGVGLFMTAKTEMVNDDITEKIVTHSRGQVNAYEVLSETKTDAGWSVKIKASIDKDILQETAKATQSQTVEFDARNIAANNISRKSKSESQLESLKSIGTLFDFTDCIKYKFSIMNSADNNFLAIHDIQLDMKKYQIKIKQLMSALDKICTKSEDIVLDENKNRNYLNSAMYVFGPTGLKTKIDTTRGGVYTHGISASFGGGGDIDKCNIGIVYSTSRAKKYIFEKEEYIRDFLRSISKEKSILFTVESGNDFDSTLSEVKSRIQICTFYSSIGPSIYLGMLNASSYIGYVLVQKLNLSNEQMMSINKLQGKYTIIK